MNTMEMNENEAVMERKNPVTLKNVCGLVAVIALALALCAPYARIPGSKTPAKAPVAIQTAVDASVTDPAL